MRSLAVIALLAVFALFGCDSSIYENTIADDNSAEAKAEQLEIYLDDKNYLKIISELEHSDGDYSTYTDREKYLLQLAYLGSTGFDLLAHLEEFLGEGENDLTSVFIKSIGGGSFADADLITSKRLRYSFIRAIDTNHNPSRDYDIAFIAGITSAVDTIMLIGSFAEELLNEFFDGAMGGAEGISFDSNAPNYIGKVFDSIEEGSAAETELLNKIGNNIDDIVENVGTLEDTIKLLGSGDTLDDLEDFLSDMRTTDPSCDKDTDPDNCINKDSIHTFIKTKIGGETEP
jgi:hypothetical protein